MKIIPLAQYRRSNPAIDMTEVQETVREILDAVRARGDAALREFSLRYDRGVPPAFKVAPADIQAAMKNCLPELRQAVRLAIKNLRRFAGRQKHQYRDFTLQMSTGVTSGQRVLPIERIGVYVPGGRFPLFSSLLMAAVPAQVAGVREIAVFSPPDQHGFVHPTILAAAGLLDISEVYCLGGAQAIAAMTYGSESIRAVHKIVGPGNSFVNQAKLAVYGQVGIDLPAGPSEIIILADESAEPAIIAADLLAQAEHDPQAGPLLITTSGPLAVAVQSEIAKQLIQLPTANIARLSLANQGAIVLVASIAEAINFINRQAPEHLELQVDHPDKLLKQFTAFGSLFIGHSTVEALGDYSSGLNHVLPTAGAARFCSGLSVRDFLRLATTLQVDAAGLQRIGPSAMRMAEAEGMYGHARSLSLRLFDRSLSS